MSMKHPMESACIGYSPGSTESQIPPQVGQDDLFGALEVKLDYIDLIRNILPMHGIWRSNLHQIIPWGWPYKSISKLGHADLLRDLAVRD